jgi:hypothetical protein
VQIVFPSRLKMKHALLVFFITPLCGILSAIMLLLSIPDLLANQYQISLSLQSFYYSSSHWTLKATNIHSTHPPIQIPLTLRHGPWLGSTQFGFLSLKSTSVPDSSKNDVQATINALGTLHYSIRLDPPQNAFPSRLEGSFNPFSLWSEGSLQGSFPLYQSQLENAQIHFVHERSLLGTSSTSLTAEIETLIHSNPDRPIEIHNLKVDLIPSFGSWRGSLLVSVHADLWSEPNVQLPDLTLDLSILNAKTKRLSDCLTLAYAAIPINPTALTMQINIKAQKSLSIWSIWSILIGPH